MSRPLIASHAFSKPDGNGGQQRVWAVEGALLDTFGSLDRLLGTWPSSFHWLMEQPEYTHLRSALISTDGEEHEYVWWAHEYFLALRLGMNTTALRKARAVLPKASVLVVDHLWLWPLLQRTILETGWSGRIVYMSHNSEALARSEYASAVLNARAEDWATIHAIERCELSLVRACDLVIACSDFDARWYQERSSTPVVVVENGAWRSKGEVSTSAHTKPYSHFGASDWHPNIEGFTQIMLPALEQCWEPQRIVVTGRVSSTLVDAVQRSSLRWPVAHEVDLRGDLPQAQFHDVVAGAQRALIPMRFGTGSNIKTAEALVNGKPAISTSNGVRGFESWIPDASGWVVADSIADWAAALSDFGGSTSYEPVTGLEWTGIRARLADHLAAFMTSWR